MNISSVLLVTALALFAGVAAAGRPPVPDPSEEITPEELSTIAEPVPDAPGTRAGLDVGTAIPRPQTASQRDSVTVETHARTPAPLWRVQILATQDRGLADRMAMDAGDLFQLPAYVTHEPPYYKVRLGDYSSEEAARPLRERAVRSGFPGAFRIRCARGISNTID